MVTRAGRQALSVKILRGETATPTPVTNSDTTRIGALERAFPMRVLRDRLRRGSDARGLHAGGEGMGATCRRWRTAGVLITERRVSGPPGVAGGQSGATGENWSRREAPRVGPSRCRTSARSRLLLAT